MRDFDDHFRRHQRMMDRGFRFFGLWFVFCLMLGLASLGGIGYAIYWGLSIAQQAVDQQETHQLSE